MVLDSPLCVNLVLLENVHPDLFFDVFTSVSQGIASSIVPIKRSFSQKSRKACWFDDDCFMARRGVRALERRYRKSKTESDKLNWSNALCSLHSLYGKKMNLFWQHHTSRLSKSPKETLEYAE